VGLLRDLQHGKDAFDHEHTIDSRLPGAY
jgi:hypothetical protein